MGVMGQRVANSITALLLLVAAGCTRPDVPRTSNGVPLAGPLVPASTTMVTAWDVPRNPLTDPSLGTSKLADEIRWGYRLFTRTPSEGQRLTPSRMACSHCHLNAGQRERALPLVDVAGMFPEYNRRSGRLYSLTDRIIDCFLRSENATGRGVAPEGAAAGVEAMPTAASKEVLALVAYLTWLARGAEMGVNPSWRGQNFIDPKALIPVAQLNPSRGEALFMERCTSCHGIDGQGVQVGDKRPGPLWGPDSWNDGAGAARVYTLAGIIRYAMPYLDPGSLTDEEAQQVAAFINSKPRPAFPYKAQDYLTEKVPVDSVYYPAR